VRDTAAVAAVLADNRPDAVIHLAGLTQVAESTARPDLYRSVNVGGTETLLGAAIGAGVTAFVFSSSAAVYGMPAAQPIREEAPLEPISPYGATKLEGERAIGAVVDALRSSDRRFGAASLRYFNVAGAAADGTLGEDHRPETHLVPSALQVALGRRAGLEIHGEDHPTDDGTCVRDYVHVEDVAAAHWRALQAVRPGTHAIYNVGLGRGFSVREVIATCRRVTGCPIPTRVSPRRAGDPPVLVACAERIEREIGWRPERPSLADMVASAWRWMRANPDGYAPTG
jgi:UDP-glucose 4-epimerase